MNEVFEKKLDKYPKLFEQRNWSMMETCMCWGIDCGSGWFTIIDKACANIQQHVNSHRQMRASALRYNRALKYAIAGNKQYLFNFYKNLYKDTSIIDARIAEEVKQAKFRHVPEHMPQIQFTQIKEKFGGLRLYTNYSDAYIDGVISMASSMSESTCETCGQPGKMRGKGWYYTACDLDSKEEDL